ncbi:RPAP1-like protein [Aspergillus leporis]|uniref:RPAP1-like protein n=1 Tax=Aspergillus leporis TaxID=41062 RepID=A0A5N5X9F2_9EURO|nr:RPAP1-like protein [Aspergillus leporis]
MAFRGERFVVDLDFDDDQASSAPPASSISIPGLIGEIRERSPAAAPAPPKPAAAGFPAHRRRAKQSAFKQRREASSTTSSTAAGQNDVKSIIDTENRRQLASMSEVQIQQEREELIESMDPALLERFLRRARIDPDEIKLDSRSNPSSSEHQANLAEVAAPRPDPVPETQPPVSQDYRTQRDDLPPAQAPDDLYPASESPLLGSVHFPTPPSQSNPMPNLDPSSPSFLSDLQAHYFPNITHDLSALSWLQPPSADADAPDSTSAYHPASDAEAVHPSALRFSFLGTLLSPSTSLSLPTNLGLHHHGKDPHAAGYTIPEIAILSRSSFPAQRCIAWQVLGRILFRLGKGQFGERGSTLVEGLWSVIEHEGVVAAMLAEADGTSTGVTHPEKESTAEEALKQGQDVPGSKGGIGRHASAAAWAVEGVWLWQMGGGGDRGVLKEGTIRSQ